MNADPIARRMLSVIDDVSSDRWQAAVTRAAEIPGGIRPEKIKTLTDTFARQVGAAGAVAGAAAAAPSVGTAATLLTTSAELAWFTSRAGDLILTIAALHGRPDPTVEERRAWVLAVLIYGGSARDEFAKALNQATTGVALATPDRRIPLASLALANRAMSRLIIRRYGTKRGVASAARLIPLGVGAVIGGSANYLAIRALARQADEFFARLPYSAIDATSLDTTGHHLAPD